MCVGAAPRSVVCVSVCRVHGRVSCVKMAEPIKVPFGRRLLCALGTNEGTRLPAKRTVLWESRVGSNPNECKGERSYQGACAAAMHPFAKSLCRLVLCRQCEWSVDIDSSYRSRDRRRWNRSGRDLSRRCPAPCQKAEEKTKVC